MPGASPEVLGNPVPPRTTGTPSVRGGTGPQTPPGIAKLAAAMTEAELERGVRRIAADLGLMAYHTRDSRRSPEGYPDWTFCGPRGVMWRELKTEKGRITPAQQDWIAALVLAGQDAAVWRPCALLSGDVARELAALAGVGR
jgi:hypothetical protein